MWPLLTLDVAPIVAQAVVFQETTVTQIAQGILMTVTGIMTVTQIVQQQTFAVLATVTAAQYSVLVL